MAVSPFWLLGSVRLRRHLGLSDLRCFRVGRRGPQPFLAGPCDVESGCVLYRGAQHALGVLLLAGLAHVGSRRLEVLLLELPLGLALLQEVLDRVLPEILGFSCDAHLITISPVALLLRVGDGLWVLVCLPIALLLWSLLLDSAREQHASRLGHQLLLLLSGVILVQDTLQEWTAGNLVASDQW